MHGQICGGLYTSIVPASTAAGLLFGSVAIAADAVNNLSDASSSVITLLGFKLAAKPADGEHPFGHARMEYLSGLSVAMLIMLIGVELIKTSMDKILHPQAVPFRWFSVAILVVSILLKCWMMAFNRALGKRLDSASLAATAADSRNDVVATSAVLVAVFAEKMTGLRLDGWMGLAVAVFILCSG
ncbi:MAG: cation diffusion facilitator family transporter, partial [Ruthenibacterium sp.]